MSSDVLKVGRKVRITGKDVQGVIAFIGPTEFASDTWIGVKLGEPKGKNNGSVQGIEYFKCEEKHGLFVKPSQVIPLDDNGKPLNEEPPRARARPSGVSNIGTKPKPTTSRMSLGSSRQSLADSRQSLSGSRHSLAGSRQSLMGSRSHLASPVMEKPDTVGEPQSQIPKRAAFVETGFVETLKPQFTPGQVITTTPTPITSVEEKISIIQLQQEIENRALQIRDLEEKLQTLKIKRQEDREKLKESDKLQIQLEQLIEFKSKIMDSHAMLQRDLQRAKQEKQEAIEAKDNHAEEVADLAEAVEMATLDKEMAEEKAETLQLELEACKERLDEVTLDLKILKTEMQGKSGDDTAEQPSMSSLEMKQLQQQNDRLRETLVRFRDHSAHEKHEYQKLIKDIDQKKSEIVELGKTKKKLSARVEEMEQQISDLQEQVDAAMGAEEMVVILGEQKLTLEDKVAKLREEVADLEALQDMNDQIVEGNAELESELREDLDMAQSATRQALRDRDAALETIADREITINKFRELVQKLQEQSLDLQHRLEKETSKPIGALPEILDFKKMFSETKAHTKGVDLELRRMEIQQLQMHVRYLTSYMPESFMNRGGDHDAVLVLLLVTRMTHKSEILLNHIKDKFAVVEKIDRAAILNGHAVEQFAFRCRLSFYIYALQAILHQYYYTLNSCKTDALLKVGGTYPEMAAQEKVIDGFVELVKRDQLDENILTEPLEKCISYFNGLFPVLLGPENRLNHTHLLIDHVKELTNACDGINTDALVIRNLIETANVGDIGLLAQHVITTVEQFQQQLKQIKRRLPDTSIGNIGLESDVFENLYHCYQHCVKVTKTLHDIVKSSIQAMTSGEELEKGLPQEKIKDIALNASDKVYEQDDLGPVQSIKNSLDFISTQITKLAQFLQAYEYEIKTANKNEEKPLPPIQLRADAVKNEMEQTKTLTSKLEHRESDIKELRKAIKEKQEQNSEMSIRKDLAEKKLSNVQKDYQLTIEKLQRKLDEANNNYKKAEKQFEETLDHLQTDIDSLENEKGEMKEKLKLLSRKTQMELSMSMNNSGSQLESLGPSSGPTLPAVVRDSPLLLQEIHNLRKLFHQERNERLKFESEKARKELEGLTPLPTFRDVNDPILDELIKEGASLKQEILMHLAKPSFPLIYKVKPGNGPEAWSKHFTEENDKLMSLKLRANQFQTKVAQEIVRRKMGGQVQADFTIFPTIEMVKALNETKPVNIGFVKIPLKLLSAEEKPRIVNLDLDYQNLQNVLQSLSCL